MLSDTEFKGEGPAPSGSRPPLIGRTYGLLPGVYVQRYYWPIGLEDGRGNELETEKKEDRKEN